MADGKHRTFFRVGYDYVDSLGRTIRGAALSGRIYSKYQLMKALRRIRAKVPAAYATRHTVFH